MLVTTEHETSAQLVTSEQESLYSTEFLSTRATAPSRRRPGHVVVAVVRLLLLLVVGHRSEVKLYCVITPDKIIVKLC